MRPPPFGSGAAHLRLPLAGRRAALPTYPFQRERFWVDGSAGRFPALALDGEVVRATSDTGTHKFTCDVRIDTPKEADYFRHGGILPYVLRQLVGKH